MNSTVEPLKRIHFFIFLMVITIVLTVISILSSFKGLANAETRETMQGNHFNIFMVETNETSKTMTLKQLCSIESAAKHNPEATVYIYSIKAEIPIKELFIRYPNIKWALMDIGKVLDDTPLKQWWLNGKLAKHDDYYKYSHLSDALRLVFVYKYGGFYSDLDHIAIKNFKPLTKYSAIVNSNPSTIDPQSSFFHIVKNHGFLKLAIEDYANNYNAENWIANGPMLLQRCLMNYCKTNSYFDILINMQSSNITSNGCDIGMLPSSVGYPYKWYDAYKMFDSNAKIQVSRFLNSFTIHFNSKVTSNHVLRYNENSIIEFFMAHNCPIVYKSIPNYN